MGLFNELKRRNVFRVGIAYLLFAWIVIQVTSTVAPVLRLPEWTMAFVLWISVIGFPFVLIFAWAFELTPDGLKREKDVDRSKSITAKTGQRLNHFVIGMLAVAVVFLVVDNYVLTGEPEAEDVAGPDTAAVEPGSYDSIGVLPFVNMSDDPEQEYFSDGIAEELLNALAKINTLQVAARTSSFAFKGQNQDITEIGRSLNVDTVLEGSVRKAGTQLRITAQLIDVRNGYHLWSETYDRELTDVFAVQDEITAAIVDALVVHLETGEEVEAPKSANTNMTAYDAYLQGLHIARQADGRTLREALALFRAATDADPEFAAAWAARAASVLGLRQTNFRDGIPAEEAFLLARDAIDRALAIDPELAEAYVSEGLLLSDLYRYDEAMISLEKAVQINPNLAEGWSWLSRLLGRFGRVEEAQESILKALRLDPHNELTVILAANLAEDFYDRDFIATLSRYVSQSARARQLLEFARLEYDEPMTAEVFEKFTSNPDFPPGVVAQIRFNLLKELDETLGASRLLNEIVLWQQISAGLWEAAQARYDALPPDRQQSALNLEELSTMQAAQGRCEEALASLDQAHGGQVRIHGEVGPNVGRSNSNLALNRVHCLRQLGRGEEAEPVLERLREYIGTLRANTEYGIYMVDAKLRVLEGDSDGALAVLEAAAARNELDWTDRHDAVLSTLSNEPRFTAVFQQLDDQIDALRAELGMPPAEL